MSAPPLAGQHLNLMPEIRERLGGICRAGVYRLAGAGKLKLVKIGKRVAATDEALDACIARCPPADIRTARKREG